MSKYANYEIKVFMVLSDKGGRLLLLQNDQKNSIIQGYLNPPAGHIEVGETVLDTVKREAQEEMGIGKLTEIRIRGFVNVSGFKDIPVFMIVVTAKIPGGEKPTDKGEGTPVWVDIKKLGQYKVLEDVEKIINLSQKTKLGSPFQAVTKFENRRLVSFEVV